MNICFFGSFTAGGTERATFLLANELSKINDHKIYIISTGFDIPTFTLEPSISFYTLKYKDIVRRWIELSRFLYKHKIDILVCIEALTGIYCLIPSFVTKCKLIVWEHANYFQNQGSHYIKIVRQIELITAKRYIVLTKRDLNNFQTHFHCTGKITQIYNIAEPYNNLRPYRIDSKIIISAGHINHIKNFLAIPSIGRFIFDRHPDWEWHIYGSGNEEETNKVKAKILDYKLENNIILKGRRESLSDIYPHSAIFVMTSLMEGCPMVLLEAKMHSLPIVSFDIETGPSEIVRDGVNGFLIEPYNNKKMADKINFLIEHPTIRKNFSTNSNLDIELFNPRTITQHWINMIKQF